MTELMNSNDLSYDMTLERKPLHPFTAKDPQNRLVTIKTKIPDNHTWHVFESYEQHPTIFWNLGSVIENPDRVYPTTSRNPEAIEHLSDGQILIYEKDEYLFGLNVPFVREPRGDTMRVVVHYNEKTHENYSLTYYLVM